MRVISDLEMTVQAWGESQMCDTLPEMGLFFGADASLQLGRSHRGHQAHHEGLLQSP